ncbi:MAG: orotate phosphoribosyltransferase [Clostridia bacterium]|nr:orotate phosphoribosyltransferase [Clostridia bacterium]
MTDFITFLLESNALKFGEFTLKSGRKSPYFMNAGEFFTDGERLHRLGGFYADLIMQSGADFNVLFGPAYKGIPLACVVGVKLWERGRRVHVSFDRKERKDHGEGGIFVGYTPKNGDRIAIIEDVTSAGTSVRETMALLQAAGVEAQITALYISLDRQERGQGALTAVQEIKRSHGIEVYSIATATDILNNVQDPAIAEAMRAYLAEYGASNSP